MVCVRVRDLKECRQRGTYVVLEVSPLRDVMFTRGIAYVRMPTSKRARSEDTHEGYKRVEQYALNLL